MIPIPKMRIGGCKVKTGCITCKVRRVKCDEARPECQRCVRGGRTCGGYLKVIPPQDNDKSIRFIIYDSKARKLPLIPSLTTKMPGRTAHAISYFMHVVASDLSPLFYAQSWRRLFMPIAVHEPAICSGLVVLATLHEQLSKGSTVDISSPSMKFVWRHYGQMIAASKSVVEVKGLAASSEAVLTCLLFSLIESFQGHFGQCRKFVQQGMGILKSQSDNRSKKTSHKNLISDLDDLHVLFTNMYILSTSISDEGNASYTAVQPYEPSSVINESFTSIDGAFTALLLLLDEIDHLGKWAIQHQRTADYPNQDLIIARDFLMSRLDDWASSFNAILLEQKQVIARNDCSKFEQACLAIRCNQLVCLIMLHLIFSSVQSDYDKFSPEFEEAIDCAERFLELEEVDTRADYTNISTPRFSATVGIIPPLFTVTVRCRYPALRHRALRLLKSTRRREGLWDAAVVSRAADMFIQCEEDRARQHQSRVLGVASDKVSLTSITNFPECIRIADIETSFQSGKSGSMILTCSSGFREGPFTLTWDS